MRRVAAILDAVALAPFIDGLRVCRENDSLDRFLTLQTAKAIRKHRRRLVTDLNRSPNLRRRRGLLVKMDQHGRIPSRLAGKQSPGLFSAPPHSLRTDLAMNKADR